MKTLVFFSAVVLMAGCAVAPVDISERLNKYNGQSIDVMVASFGAPDKTHKGSNGNIYQWVFEHRSNQTDMGPYSYDYRYKCELITTTNSKNIVLHTKTRSIDNHPYVDACDRMINKGAAS